MRLLILSLLLVAAAPGVLSADENDILSNQKSLRHSIEEANSVAILEVNKNGSVTPRLSFRGANSDQPNAFALAGGPQQAGVYLYIEKSQKFDPTDIHSPAWGSDSFISATWSRWNIPLEKGFLALSDGHRLYMADLIGLILTARSQSK